MGQLFGCYRKVYNLCLSESTRLYETTGSGMVTLTDFGHYFHRVLLKDPSLSYLKDHNTKILKDSFSNLAKAFTNFFRGAGYPQYKRLGDAQSVSLYKEAFSKHALSVPDFLFISKRFGMLRYRTSPEYKSFITEHGSELRRMEELNTSRAPMSRIYACGDTAYGRPSALSGLRSSVSRKQEVAKLC